MRVVSLNIDLPDLIVVKRAVDAYLDQCQCRQKRAGEPCQGCLSLEATRDEIARLANSPCPRVSPPHGLDEGHSPWPASLFGAGWEPERPHLRVVSRVEAGG